MWFVISLIIVILSASSIIWLRNKWIFDTFGSYGVYGRIAGLYLYRKYGLWHIGISQDEPSQTVRNRVGPKSIVTGELDLKPGYTRQVKTYS